MDVSHAVGVKAGIPGSKIEALTAYQDSPVFTERERAALAFSEQVTRDDREVSDECWRRLREHFSEADCVELMAIVGFQIFASKLAKGFAVPPQGFSS